MGLCVSNNCFQGPYSLFSRWRIELANVAQLAGDRTFQYWMEIFPDGLPSENSIEGIWESPEELEIIRTEPLWILLCHSDCDGYIKPKEGVPLAKRLVELAPLMEDYTETNLRFALGLTQAAKQETTVWFG